ncbi:MAG: zinc ribbon domain-containing protein [Chloroflexi bacterium]|nr:MAG: zinc ribbon domain-containing protein [Chloroflexota bacterium]
MPIYEYRCKDCGTEFEKILRFSEADQLPACPHCNSPSTRKKLSTTISFGKGSSPSSSTSGSSCGTSSGFS